MDLKYMTGGEIRESFLTFYEKKGHKRLESASLVPNDPQLLFTVAGMVPFKPIFWGKVKPTYATVVSCQKCVRTNDIEEVGKTPRHHTFFEMLGNFSFGDYFKEGAIDYAWEYVTKTLELPEEKLCVSVYKDDDEAYDIWKERIGIPGDKIYRLDKDENYWGPAGPTGPCGPCSEIFYDRGPQKGCSDPQNCDPSCECGRFLEFYNLVFTEYNYNEDGTYTPLARKNIDTGLGLERIASVMQGVASNFETDLFKPIIAKTEEITAIKADDSEEAVTALRVISDHTRSAVFMIADGILPSNEGRGYVLKRLIRRALRFGWLHGMRNPFLNKLVPVVVEKMGDHYWELSEKSGIITKVLLEEEKRFIRTMQQGLEMLDDLMKDREKISGEEAFKLYDTYGFPVEVTQEIAEEKGVEVDIESYQQYMAMQKEQSREARGNKEYKGVKKVYEQLNPDEIRDIQFIGYQRLETKTEVLFLIRDDKLVEHLEAGQTGDVVLKETPFYDEKGGQVSDVGKAFSDSFSAAVEDGFNPYNQVIVHRMRIESGSINKGDTITLQVDPSKRMATARNHSATHLLHAALKEVLGSHIKQAGSLVAPGRLRFDFSHFKSVTTDELSRVEDKVNEKIMDALTVTTEIMGLEEARKKGVTALFDEKYSQEVRVVRMGDYSAELCGGTHVQNTGQIGPFKITGESGISSGVRRIEASTGWNTLNILERHEETIDRISKTLSTEPTQVLESVEKLSDDYKKMSRKAKELEEKLSHQNIKDVIQNRIKEVDGIKYLAIVNENMNNNVLRTVADNAMDKFGSGLIVIFNKMDEKVIIVVKVSKDLAGKRLHAGKIAKKLAGILGGGGGGRPDFAQAGGKNREKVEEAERAIPEIIKNG